MPMNVTITAKSRRLLWTLAAVLGVAGAFAVDHTGGLALATVFLAGWMPCCCGISTTCCSPMAEVLTVTVTSKTGSLIGLPDDFEITHGSPNAVSWCSEALGVTCLCLGDTHALYFLLDCIGSGATAFRGTLFLSDAGGCSSQCDSNSYAPPFSGDCSPLELVYFVDAPRSGAGACAVGSATFTVTE